MKKEPLFVGALQKASKDKGRTKFFLLFLLLSFLFWFVTKFSKTYTEVIVLEFSLVNMPTSILPTLNRPLQIEATLSASGFQFLYYAFIDNRLELDMKDAQFEGGRSSIPVAAQFQDLQEQLLGTTRIINYFPTTLEFDFQTQFSKKLPVRLPPLEMAVGYNTISYAVTPDSVTVVGPEKEVMKLTETTPVIGNQSALNESFTEEVELLPLPSYIAYDQDKVTVSAVISRFSESRIEQNLTIKNSPAEKVYKLYPSQVEVTFSAPIEILKSFDPSDIEIGVDIDKIDPALNTPLRVVLFKFPPELKNIRWRPEEVNYLIRE